MGVFAAGLFAAGLFAGGLFAGELFPGGLFAGGLLGIALSGTGLCARMLLPAGSLGTGWWANGVALTIASVVGAPVGEA